MTATVRPLTVNRALAVEVLLAYVLGTTRERLYAEPERVLRQAEHARFHELVSRRARHEPVAYLTGRKAFHAIEVGVSEHTLIPRPETETLVEVALEKLGVLADERRREPPRVLDIGTGSGAVALAIAYALPGVQVVGLDVQHQALEQARLNAEQLGLAGRCRFLVSDIFAEVPPGSLFDLIVSIPPYVADDELAATPPDVRSYEPHAALLGGELGLDFYHRIVPAAPEFLAPRGFLAVEIAEHRADEVTAIFRECGRFEQIAVRDDLGGSPRVVVARERA